MGSLRFEFQQAMDLTPDSSPARGGGASPRGTTMYERNNAKQVLRRDAFLLAMHQEANEGRKLSQECVVLLVASRGHQDVVLAKGRVAGMSGGRKAIEGMLAYVDNEAGDIIRSIDVTLDLNSDDKNALEEAIKAYFSTW